MKQEADIGQTLRGVMGCFPTGVTVVAALDPNGSPFGLTVNAFTSVSLDPPLVLVCIDRRASSHDLLLSAARFTVNILRADQAEVATRFSKEPSHTRFEQVAWHRSESGEPLLEGASAWLECSLHEICDGGDHYILVGRVASASVEDGPSLVFYRGTFQSTAG